MQLPNVHRHFRWVIIVFVASFLSIEANYGQATEANLLGRWSQDSLPGSFNHNNVYNEIWGYARDGHEFAIIGTTAGTHFIEVTDPTQPEEVAFVPGRVQGGAIIHRDFHDYRGFLYAASGEGSQSTLQVIDMRQLPDTVTVVYDERDLSSTSHNIFIDTVTARLYSLTARGGNVPYAPLRIFDIQDPAQPKLLSSHDRFGNIRPSHVHDAFVLDDIAFLNLGFDGLVIADFRNPDQPDILSTVTEYPARGYNHSGWISSDCSTYYFGDENHGFDLKTLNISNLCEPEIVGTFDAEVDNPNSITHNQVVAGDHLYVSYYYDGLRVYDISDPFRPTLTEFYDTYDEPDGTAYRGAWGVYPFLPSGTILVSDMQSGLFVFEGPTDASQRTAADPACLRQQLCQTTSVEEPLATTAIYLVTNPVRRQFQLQMPGQPLGRSASLMLYSTAGQPVANWALPTRGVPSETLTFDLPTELVGGVYWLVVPHTTSMESIPLVVLPD